MKLGQENCKIYIVIFENSLYNAKIRKTVKEEKRWQILREKRLSILLNWQCLI